MAVRCSVSAPSPAQTFEEGQTPKWMVEFYPMSLSGLSKNVGSLIVKVYKVYLDHPQVMGICCKNTQCSLKDRMLGKSRKS